MRAVGLDGTRKGWAVATLEDGPRVVHHHSFARVLQAHPAAECFGIDIPIGLTDAEPRAVDRLVRKAVGPRYRSVFPAPIRPALEQPDRKTADRVSRAHGGPGVSAQAWALAEKIREIDAHAHDTRLHEVHPELSFATMKGAHLHHTKRSYAGVLERLELIRYHLGEPEVSGAADLPVDDVLDALAVLWTALRIRAGEAVAHPAHRAQRDSTTNRVLRIYA